jgi:Epoxide hydrolase N terminus
MDEKDKSTFHAPYHVGAIMFLMIGIIVTGIFVCTLVLNQNHTAMAQQQLQQQGQALASKDISFEIDNVTFSHHMASVNGIQLHYVIGGNGDPLVLIHGWPQTWFE